MSEDPRCISGWIVRICHILWIQGYPTPNSTIDNDINFRTFIINDFWDALFRSKDR
jgi:hypothetical protein